MKKNISLLVISLLLMVLAPFLATKFTPATLTMPICMSILFIAYPLYYMILGYICGRDIKKTFFQPILAIGFFLLGVFLFYTINEVLFFVIAGGYLLLSIVLMVTSASKPKKEKKVKVKKNKKKKGEVVDEEVIETN